MILLTKCVAIIMVWYAASYNRQQDDETNELFSKEGVFQILLLSAGLVLYGISVKMGIN